MHRLLMYVLGKLTCVWCHNRLVVDAEHMCTLVRRPVTHTRMHVAQRLMRMHYIFTARELYDTHDVR